MGHGHSAVFIEPGVVQLKLPQVEPGRDEASSALGKGERRECREHESKHVKSQRRSQVAACIVCAATASGKAPWGDIYVSAWEAQIALTTQPL